MPRSQGSSQSAFPTRRPWMDPGAPTRSSRKTGRLPRVSSPDPSLQIPLAWILPGDGNRLLAGRDFTWLDIHAMRPVTLVSENLAREYWGTPAAAVGKRIRENPKGTWREIVGVVGNERDNGIDQEAPTIVYWPLMIRNFWSAPIEVRRTLVFAIRSKRTGSDTLEGSQPGSMGGELGASVRKRSHGQRNLRTVDGAQFLHARDARSRCGYGSVAWCGGHLRRRFLFAFAADSRDWNSHGSWRDTPASEKPVRPTRADTRRHRGGLWRGYSHPLTRLMSALLFKVSPLDPLTYAAVSIGLVAAALLASYLPARRATRIAPVEALRAE